MALSGDEVFGTEVPGFVTDGDGRLVVVGPGGESINADDTRYYATGQLNETVLDRFGTRSNAGVSSGLLRVTALKSKLTAGTEYSSITFWSGSTGSTTLTQSWACLIDLDEDEVLVSSTSNTDEWTANTARTFSFSSAYTPSADIEHPAVGIVVVASTPNNVIGASGDATVNAAAPKINGFESGYTTPVAASTSISLSASGNLYYAQVK